MYQFHTDHPTPYVYLDIARGAISNSKLVHKFGANFDIDIRVNEVSGNDARVTANFDIVLIKD